MQSKLIGNIPVSAFVQGSIAILKAYLLNFTLHIATNSKIERASFDCMLLCELVDNVRLVFVIFKIMHLIPRSQATAFV